MKNTKTLVLFAAIAGNLVADAVKKTISGGKAVLEFRIGADVRGEKLKDTEAVGFINCEVWGEKRIEAALAVLKKGVTVELSGLQKIRQYNDKDGDANVDVSFNVSYGDVLTFNGKGVAPTKTPLFPKAESGAAE